MYRRDDEPEEEREERPRKKNRVQEERRWWTALQIVWTITAIWCLLLFFLMFYVQGFQKLSLAAFAIGGYLIASCAGEWERAKRK